MYSSIYTMIEKAVTGEVNKIAKEEIIEQCYALLQKRSNNYSYIVFDNLERVFNNEQIKEELITLIQCLEDKELNKYKVRYLLVGIPSSLKEFFHSIDYFQPIANRITEITKLNGFSAIELKQFLQDTLLDKLHYDLSSSQLDEIKDYTMLITDGMPLRVQQYLLLLANLIQSNYKAYDKHLLPKAAHELLKGHYSEIETLAEQYFNTPTNKFSRGNQLIFILGKLGHDNVFTIDSLQKLFSKFFPITTNSQDLRISRYLTPLTVGNPPLVKKIDKNKFRVVDGNIKIWINSSLYIEENTEIVRQSV